MGGLGTMIRFEPDTWRDALLRPIAMAAPDGGVYIEIMAPDPRFALAIALVAVHVLFWLSRRRSSGPLWPTAVLLLAISAAFYPWLKNTGNGRYFLAFLLAVGPLCIALVYLLPVTRGFRLALAGCLVATQAFIVNDSDPVRFWGLSQWGEGRYFHVSVPEDLLNKPATYITLSNISYSLVAPLFHPTSRWIHIPSIPTDPEQTLIGRRAHAALRAGEPLYLLVPTVPEYANLQGLPDEQITRSLATMLVQHRLSLTDVDQCRILRSQGLASLPAYLNRREADKRFELAGFWLCPLRYESNREAPQPQRPTTQFDAVFDKVETLCPRFFRPREAVTKVVKGGEMRQYGESDMKVYVMEDGAVFYKYFRAFSDERIGTVDEVMSGQATVDCSNIRGRSGLPWERRL
jgi:hypothetical protein